MTDPIGRGTYELTADRTQLKQELAAAEGDIQASGSVAEKQEAASIGKLQMLSGPAKSAIIGVGAQLVHAGELAMAMGHGYTEATNTIVQKTGASGAALAALQTSMRNVAGQVPESLGVVADAVSEVSIKLGLVGPPLDEATKKFIDFARLNHLEVPAAIDSVTAAMARMQIPAEQLPAFLDKLTVATQLTGIHATDLTSALATVGPQLQDMGYSLDGSIALIGAWNKAGGDAGELAGAMNKAFAKFAKEGATDGASAMQILVDKIKNAPNDFTAAAAAVEIFGKKGTVMAQMIRDGTLDVDALTASIGANTDALDTTTEATKTWTERFQEFFNGIAAQVGPFASQMSDIGGALSNFGSIASTLKPIASFLIERLKGTAEKVIPTATAEGALIGEAEGAAEAEGATGPKAIQGWVTKYEAMTGEKVIAARAAGLEEGAAEGLAAGEAAGANFGRGFLGKLGAGLLGGGAAVAFSMSDLEKTVIAANAAGTATVYANSLAPELKAKVQQAYIDAWIAAKASGASGDAAKAAAVEAARQTAATYFPTLANEMGSHAAWANVGKTLSDEMGSHAIWQSVTDVVANAAKTAFGFAGGASGDAFVSQVASHIKSERGDEQAAADKARADTNAFITGVYDNKDAAKQSWKTFIDEMNHPLDAAKEIAWIKGKLASKRLQDGLHSSDPVIQAQSETEFAALTARMNDLVSVYGDKSKAAAHGLLVGLGSTYFEAQREASHFVSNFNDILSGIEKNRTVNVGVTYHDTGGGKGGGRALGGPVAPNTMYEVAEGGIPEILGVGGRTYLLMGAKAGTVLPIKAPAIAPKMADLSAFAPASSRSTSTTARHEIAVALDITPQGARALRDAGYNEQRVGQVVVDTLKTIARGRLTATVDMSGVTD